MVDSHFQANSIRPSVGGVSATPSDPQLSERRGEIAAIQSRAREMFTSGRPAREIVAEISRATDQQVVGIFLENLARFGPAEQRALASHSTLVATGGTGRGELAPWSDVDLLLLYDPSIRTTFENLTAPFVRNCWDAGLRLGHGVRTVTESLSLARRDPKMATTLLEMRPLWGARPLFDRLQLKLRNLIRGAKRNEFFQSWVNARREERLQHGQAIGLLEPDVKCSPGGLRDLHLIRWLGVLLSGKPNPAEMFAEGLIDGAAADALEAAHDMLTRIRIDLHLSAGRAQDMLTRDEQRRIAASRSIPEQPGLSGVEIFMREYFRHTGAVARAADRLVALHQPVALKRKAAQFFLGRRLNDIYHVSDETIDVAPRNYGKVCRNLESLLELHHTAALYGLTFAPALSDRVRARAATLPDEVSPAAAARFMQLCAVSGNLGPTIRHLYDCGLLEIVIPDYAHARGLLQFNQYHCFTVDEHSLQTVEEVEQLQGEQSLYGEVYRSLKRKEILRLALLLHDLGKGFPEDHSDVGKVIAERIADRLGLELKDREALVFLVHKHLLMALLGFRRDISDPATPLELTREAGTSERLKMLFVMTCADIRGVGPGRWTSWKAELLSDLFRRGMQILSGELPSASRDGIQQEIVAAYLRQRESANASVTLAPSRGFEASGDRGAVVPPTPEDSASEPAARIEQALATLPGDYLSGTDVERILADLEIARQLDQVPIHVEAKVQAEAGTVEYRVITRESTAPGCFHRIAGALTANGLEILSAEICTSGDGIIIDSFRVVDNDFIGPIPEFRLSQICNAVRSMLIGEIDDRRLFRRRRFGGDSAIVDLAATTRVVLDNESSDRCTIIDVFAHDRYGLLFTIARAIHRMKLAVVLAKISTHFDQIVDVFYVVDEEGSKIRDAERLRTIQSELMRQIDEFERHGFRETDSQGRL